MGGRELALNGTVATFPFLDPRSMPCPAQPIQLRLLALMGIKFSLLSDTAQDRFQRRCVFGVSNAMQYQRFGGDSV